MPARGSFEDEGPRRRTRTKYTLLLSPKNVTRLTTLRYVPTSEGHCWKRTTGRMQRENLTTTQSRADRSTIGRIAERSELSGYFIGRGAILSSFTNRVNRSKEGNNSSNSHSIFPGAREEDLALIRQPLLHPYPQQPRDRNATVVVRPASGDNQRKQSIHNRLQ